jgi:hypothetical protein
MADEQLRRAIAAAARVPFPDGVDAPAAPSLVAGALDRSVVDAAAAYSTRLAALWAEQLQQPAP